MKSTGLGLSKRANFLSLSGMEFRKLDPKLRSFLKQSDGEPAVLVSVRLATEASEDDRLEVARLLDSTVEPGAPVLNGTISPGRLGELSDHPSVTTIRLSRILHPLVDVS